MASPDAGTPTVKHTMKVCKTSHALLRSMYFLNSHKEYEPNAPNSTW